MKLIFVLYFLPFFCSLLIGCNQRENAAGQDIRGIWLVEAGDTSLVVIYSRDFFAHHSRDGDLYLNYLVRGDSLLLSQDSISVSKGKLISTSDNEFFLINTPGKARFTRIKSDADTARLRTLVNWRKKGRRYTQEYNVEHARNMNETRDIWESILNASR
jgi:hypothetical protein